MVGTASLQAIVSYLGQDYGHKSVNYQLTNSYDVRLAPIGSAEGLTDSAYAP